MVSGREASSWSNGCNAGETPASQRTAPAGRPQIRLDPDNARNGLVQLVLTVVELLRDLLERQALRRIESGSLRPEEEERIGLTFLRLSEEMDRLKRLFQLTDEDLNLNLGPLGRLR